MLKRYQRELATEMALLKYTGAYAITRPETPVEATAIIKESADFHINRAFWTGAALGPLLLALGLWLLHTLWLHPW